MLVSRICGSRHYFLWRTTVNLRCSQIYFQPCSYSISDCKDGTSANHYRPSFEVKHFSTSSIFCEKEKLKPSSLVEETVDSMREEEKRKQDLVSVSGEQKKEIAKKSLWARFVGELKHYYHGFRLLYIESKIAFGFAWKMLKGESLSRREHKQLVRTTADLFRLVPFSVFIIIPFMEFLLPVFIKLFPSMLPSTFQSANEKEAKIKANLKLKLEMARFLQQTLDDMALKGKGRESERAREFVEFFNRVRTSGEAASNEEIMRFSKLFEDEITLESLTRPQLLALCRLLEIQPMGTNNFLRFQLQLKLRSLAADDKVIQKEGLESLTASELQAACRARGMRSHGFPAERLRQQLTQWLDLSLNEKVPPSLLLLSRTLYLPESVPTTDQLKATISSLPESITTPTEDAIAEKEGRIDNVVRLKLIKEEQEKIKAEREEQKKMEAEKKKKGLPEVLVDVAPILQDRAKALERKKEEEFSSDDLAALEDALENVGVEKRKLLLEKEELSEIKKELQDYEEDLKDLDKFMKSSGQPPQFLRESKAARRLYKRVNNIIGNLDDLVHSLEKNKKILKEEAKTVSFFYSFFSLISSLIFLPCWEKKYFFCEIVFFNKRLLSAFSTLFLLLYPKTEKKNGLIVWKV
ncbi:hypothetical protein QYM36_010859 [Artemia franciscana]|uniref:Letm1 RBD domain-containing protein n=1 Tax=Artemia franciscana TaxID=6661 RepID=A0AA88L414_ARTSF|nr:hypothetical protein QYM36_010859 [Artemia franciscana]